RCCYNRGGSYGRQGRSLTLRIGLIFFFSSRRRHTRCYRDWSSDVCSSDLGRGPREVGHRPVALDEGKLERQHVGFGWKVEEQLAGLEVKLEGQPVFDLLEQVGVLARPPGRSGGQFRRRQVERSLREPPLTQPSRQAGGVPQHQIVD